MKPLADALVCTDWVSTRQLRDGIHHQLKTSANDEVDLLNWMGRTALELVGQGALGHSFDPLTKNVPNAYGDALKAFM